jgi:hypothetical protein
VRPRLSWLVAGALGLLALLSLAERQVWVGALLAELRPWLFLLALATVASFTLMGERIAASASAALGVALAISLAPVYRSTRPTPQAGPLLRVAHVHAAGEPFGRAALGSWLAQLGHVDVVAVSGLRAADAALPTALSGFAVHPPATPGAPALFVAARAAGVRFPDDLGPLSNVSLAIGACRVRVVAIDVPSRFDRKASTARAAQLASLERLPPIVRSVWLGHLGSRVDASDVAGLLSAQQLRDSRRSHGLMATAPASLGALGVPLDHVLVHGWVGVRDRSVEAAAAPGTHRTVRATLELTEPRCRP